MFFLVFCWYFLGIPQRTWHVTIRNWTFLSIMWENLPLKVNLIICKLQPVLQSIVSQSLKTKSQTSLVFSNQEQLLVILKKGKQNPDVKSVWLLVQGLRLLILQTSQSVQNRNVSLQLAFHFLDFLNTSSSKLAFLSFLQLLLLLLLFFAIRF